MIYILCQEKSYEKVVNEILENIKSLQLSPSVLEELVQKHYIENKKIVSLEGNLLRLAMDQKIPRNEFIKFYIGNEINPNLKKFLDDNIFKIEKQNNSNSYYWPKLNADVDGKINWDWDARDIASFIRGFSHPFNGAFSYIGKYKVKVLVNHRRRYDDEIIKLTKLIKKGIIGEILQVSSHYVYGLLTTGTHVIDTLRFLFK